MSEDQSMNLLWAILALVLVGSSLIARQIPLKTTAKMALAWVAIFGGLFFLFALRDDFGGIWQKVKLAALGHSAAVDGAPLRIALGEDGHFRVNATVNGQTVRFLIDSGATTTALDRETADAASIPVDESGFPVLLSTANGMVEARRGRIARFDVAGIVREDFAVTVSDKLGDNLVGMNFLSSLKSWRVEGRTLVLEP